MLKLRTSLLSLLSILLINPTQANTEVKQDPITLFTAKKIITMDAANPEATAVAVQNGLILGVGTLEDLQPWLKNKTYTINDQFKDKVLMPGFVDPHLHPVIAALLLSTVWITPEAWNVMDKQVSATQGHKKYLAALKKAFDQSTQTNNPFVTWGYCSFFHGSLSRQDLDALSLTRPIMVWERSTHQAYFNTAALNKMKLSAAEVKNNAFANYNEGHFWEEGFIKILPRLLQYHFFNLTDLNQEYKIMRSYLNHNGITTIADMSTGILDWDLELKNIQQAFDVQDSPLRVLITPDPASIADNKEMPPLKTLALINHCNHLNSNHVVCKKSIKLFADGALFSQMMQLTPPGYIDGHQGTWLSSPEELKQLAQTYWNAGYQIHVHANGDAGLKLVLDTLEQLENEKPRADHRFTIEHYGYATNEQATKIAKLGALVSANPFYLYSLRDKFSKIGLGADRADKMTPLRSLVKEHVPFALHSDFAIAPAQPLFLAQIAATRKTIKGKTAAPGERLTLNQALKAITINAAYVLHLEDQIGSIEAGKTADFTVLYQDPYKVPLEQLKDIKIWGTVFAGKVFQAAKENTA